MYISPIPYPSGGALRIVTTLGAGGGGRGPMSATIGIGAADGEVVWS